MPLYSYKCPDCCHIVELLLPVAQMDSKPECPRCDNGVMSRIPTCGTFSMRPKCISADIDLD